VSARLVRVIEVVTKRGAGIPADPVRDVTTYYDEDGKLLAEADPYAEIASQRAAEEAALEAYARLSKEKKA